MSVGFCKLTTVWRPTQPRDEMWTDHPVLCLDVSENQLMSTLTIRDDYFQSLDPFVREINVHMSLCFFFWFVKNCFPILRAKVIFRWMSLVWWTEACSNWRTWLGGWGSGEGSEIVLVVWRMGLSQRTHLALLNSFSCLFLFLFLTVSFTSN